MERTIRYEKEAIEQIKNGIPKEQAWRRFFQKLQTEYVYLQCEHETDNAVVSYNAGETSVNVFFPAKGRMYTLTPFESNIYWTRFKSEDDRVTGCITDEEETLSAFLALIQCNV